MDNRNVNDQQVKRGFRFELLWILPIIALVYFSTASVTMTQTEEGLYEQKCGRCHESYKPSDYSAKEWPGLVRTMRAKAALSSGESEAITNYLVNNSSDNGQDNETSGPVIGGYLYTEYFATEKENKNFDIHYLAVHLSGWLNEKIEYMGEFELEHGGKGDNTFVEQAYLNYWFIPNIALKVGSFLTPFNRFDDFHDPIANPIITRPQMSRELGVSAWKDVGVDLNGYLKLDNKNSVLFDLYAINGLGDGKNLRSSRHYRDNNEKLAFGGRVSFVIQDIIELGGSGYQGAWDENGDYNLSMLGGHLLVKTDIVDIYGEYTTAKSENPAEDTLGNIQQDGDMTGYFVQVSKLIDKKFRPTIRYGNLDYLDNGAALGRKPTDKDLTEIAFGFTYYPVSKVAFKAEYTIFDEGDRNTETDNNQIGLQAAIEF